MTSPPLHILLTGGRGFLGQHIARVLLQAGHRVQIFQRAPAAPMAEHPNLSYCTGDLTDCFDVQAAVEGKDLVVHAGGRVSFRRLDRADVWRNNLEGTTTLVQAMLNAPEPARLIHISSIAALGRSFRPSLVTEAQIWKTDPANTWYAYSKYKAELEVWRAAEEGLATTILNPAVILGPGPWTTGTGQLFNHMHSGLSWYPGGETGFVDVRDVALAVLHEISTPSNGKRYILASENASWQSVLNQIATALQVPPPTRKIPSKATLPLAKSLEWMLTALSVPSPLPYEILLNSSLKHTYASDAFLQAHPEFRFRPLATTIQETAAAYLQQL